MPHPNEQKPNFRDDNDKLFLVRCFACEPDHGRENYLPAVASGQCAWCGWIEALAALLPAKEK